MIIVVSLLIAGLLGGGGWWVWNLPRFLIPRLLRQDCPNTRDFGDIHDEEFLRATVFYWHGEQVVSTEYRAFHKWRRALRRTSPHGTWDYIIEVVRSRPIAGGAWTNYYLVSHRGWYVTHHTSIDIRDGTADLMDPHSTPDQGWVIRVRVERDQVPTVLIEEVLNLSRHYRNADHYESAYTRSYVSRTLNQLKGSINSPTIGTLLANLKEVHPFRVTHTPFRE